MRFVTSTLSLILAAGLTAICAPISAAQDAELIETPVPAKPVYKVIRNSQPVTYWVDADKLSVRDNPVAGDVTSVLELGKKVRAYSRFENWVRISRDGREELWVNSDYLTDREVGWANYSFSGNSSRNRASRQARVFDVDMRKIDLENNPKARLYAARIQELPNRNRTIVTKQSFRSGPYFEKHLISCAQDGAASAQQLVGEGYSYMMMERDPRSQDLSAVTPKYSAAQMSQTQKTVADFACANLPN